MRSAIAAAVAIVRDHHGRLAVARDAVPEQLQDLAAGRRVEVARRLVREDDARLRDERAGDRDALLLAAGELGRPVRPPVAEADPVDQLLDPRPLRLAARELERQEDVLLGRQHRQQVEELEHEADVAAPELRELGVAERAELRVVDPDLAARSAGRGRRAGASGRTCRSPTGPSRRRARPRSPPATRPEGRRRRRRRRRSGGSGRARRRGRAARSAAGRGRPARYVRRSSRPLVACRGSRLTTLWRAAAEVVGRWPCSRSAPRLIRGRPSQSEGLSEIVRDDRCEAVPAGDTVGRP